jgi:hypothetical protein
MMSVLAQRIYPFLGINALRTAGPHAGQTRLDLPEHASICVNRFGYGEQHLAQSRKIVVVESGGDHLRQRAAGVCN